MEHLDSRCQALSNGHQCRDSAEEGTVLCDWHQGIIDGLFFEEMHDVQKLFLSTIMDEGFSLGLTECS